MNILQQIWYFSFWLWVRIGLSGYFTTIKISGKENLVKGAPMIWGANHENALIDPLIKTTRFPITIHYLVRADVFKNPIVRWFLNSLNLMPVYRIRDGVNSVKANEEIFRNCFEAFKKKEHLILYPEASHDHRRQRKISKKGIARIALGAMNEPDAPEKLYIVPVGTNYSRHKWFRSSVHVVFGEPIEIKKIPETNENIDALKSEYEEAAAKCAISLKRSKFEVLDKILLHDLGPNDLLNPKEINKKAEEVESKLTEEKEKEILEVAGQLEKAGLQFPFERRKNYWLSFVKAIILLPLALMGGVMHLPSILIGRKIMNGIKDKVYVDTIHFGVGLVCSTLSFWVFAILAWSFTGIWWMVLLSMGITYTSLGAMGEFRKHWLLFRANQKFTNSKTLPGLYQKFTELVNPFRA